MITPIFTPVSPVGIIKEGFVSKGRRHFLEMMGIGGNFE
jgi:hypothetical protein